MYAVETEARNKAQGRPKPKPLFLGPPALSLDHTLSARLTRQASSFPPALTPLGPSRSSQSAHALRLLLLILTNTFYLPAFTLSAASPSPFNSSPSVSTSSTPQPPANSTSALTACLLISVFVYPRLGFRPVTGSEPPAKPAELAVSVHRRIASGTHR